MTALVPLPPGGGPPARRRLTLEQLLPPFLTWRLVARGSPDNTVRSYGSDLRCFVRFCHQHKIAVADQVTHHVIEAYLGWLTKVQGRSPVTANRRRQALVAWWRWMRREGYTTGNPAADVYAFKQPLRLPEYLTIPEQQTLFDELPKDRTPEGRFDYAVIATGDLCGLRVSELATLRVDHVDLAGGKLRVVGKGNKERELPIIPRLATILGDYLKNVRPLFTLSALEGHVYRTRGGWGGYWIVLAEARKHYVYGRSKREVQHAIADALRTLPDPTTARSYVYRDPPGWCVSYWYQDKKIIARARSKAEAEAMLAERALDLQIKHASPYVFPRSRGRQSRVRPHRPVDLRPINPRILFYLIRRRVFAILGKKIGPHRLRHSFAATLRENGADLALIQEALGHADIKTTTMYAHLSTKKRLADITRFLEGQPSADGGQP